MGKSYAVLGLGKFGKSVALNLMKDGAEVLAVDQKEELVRDIVDYVTWRSLCGCYGHGGDEQYRSGRNGWACHCYRGESGGQCDGFDDC